MTPSSVGPGWAFNEARYAPVHERQARSPTLRDIWLDAYGDEYPNDAKPLGFSTLTDLERLAELLDVGPGTRFIDIGCGSGGASLWVARRTGAAVVGIDVVPAAIEQAERRKDGWGLSDRAAFHVASAVETGFLPASFDAAMSIDALWMVLDKPAALAEVARVLAPRGRFAFTTWEPHYLDHRELLAEAGLEVLVQEEPAAWRERQLAVYKGILAAQEQLLAELGDEATAVLVAEATAVPELLQEQVRLRIAAERRE